MTETDYIKAKLDFIKLLMGSVVGTAIVLAITTGPNPVAELIGFILLLVFILILSREYNNEMKKLKDLP